MGIAKITRNYQITIPKYIRELIKIREGDTLTFVVEGNKISLSKTNKDVIEDTAGIWKIKETGSEYQKKIRSQWAKRKRIK